VAGSCKHGKKNFGSLGDGVYPGYFSYYQLPRKAFFSIFLLKTHLELLWNLIIKLCRMVQHLSMKNK